MKARRVTKVEVGEIICGVCQTKVDEAMELFALLEPEDEIMSKEFSKILKKQGREFVDEIYFCAKCFCRERS